jgi:hypothetical protein
VLLPLIGGCLCTFTCADVLVLFVFSGFVYTADVPCLRRSYCLSGNFFSSVFLLLQETEDHR